MAPNQFSNSLLELCDSRHGVAINSDQNCLNGVKRDPKRILLDLMGHGDIRNPGREKHSLNHGESRPIQVMTFSFAVMTIEVSKTYIQGSEAKSWPWHGAH
jgi:hypothetical protein